MTIPVPPQYKQIQQYLSAVTLAVTAAVLCCQFAYAESLKFYSAPYTLAPETKHRFEQITAITIDQINFESRSDRDRTLLHPAPYPLDIVVIDQKSVVPFSKREVLSDLPNTLTKHTQPDICGENTVPFRTRQLGFAYRTSKFSQPMSSWQDILTPSHTLNKSVVMLSDSEQLLIPALKRLNYPADTHKVPQLKSAYTLLRLQLPNVIAYGNPLTQAANKQIAEQIKATMLYESDLPTLKLLTGHNDWQFVNPLEGSTRYWQCLAILNSSKQPDKAAKLIDFLATKQGNQSILGSEQSEQKKNSAPESANDNSDQARGLLFRQRIRSQLMGM